MISSASDPSSDAPRRLALLEAIIESAQDYAVITMASDRTVTSWNPGAETLLGWSQGEAVGRSADVIFTPEDRDADRPQIETELAQQAGRAEDERWHMRRDGSRFWGSGLLMPLRGEGISGYVKIMRDRTADRLAEQALRDSELRFRKLAENIPQLVWRSRGFGERTWISPQWVAYSGLPEEKGLGLGWLETVHPEDRHATIEAWKEAEMRGEFHVDHRIRRGADGEYRWFQSRASRLSESEGGAAEWFGTSTDMHELRRLQERQQVLLRELHHRSRNLMSVIASVARRTLALSSSLEEFEESFTTRLAALARVQGLVTGADRREADLRDIIEAEIAAHGAGVGDRVQIKGPPITLRDRAAETLALSLHELATNALKYGALAGDSGRLTVEWSRRGDSLLIEWTEGGITVKPGPRRRGYGTELIEVALPHALGAETKLELKESGLHCVIEIPLEEVELEK
jgi:PAS domain S-box-containing protein